ncbi:hypothetical protein [Falsiroseomonas oryziterrae]|uniref:hypothetical protein n=1 Tax=Falsiroseomonas oryziterrae TaxID=2911368 RepID=UPI001F422572|nr:hypothetical protein [Roseomonas sp. NPKOSM-4]
MDAGTIKLLVAIVIFSAPVIICAEMMPKQEILGRRFTRAQAQAIGAVIGLVGGVGFLLATG